MAALILSPHIATANVATNSPSLPKCRIPDYEQSARGKLSSHDSRGKQLHLETSTPPTRTVMADTNNVDDFHSTTPLDLLLNAISGSEDYAYPRTDNVLEETQDTVEGGEESEQLSLGGLLEASRFPVGLIVSTT